ASGRDDAAVDHVAHQLGRCLLEDAPHAVGDLLDRLLERLDDVLRADRDALRQAVDEVAAAHLDLDVVVGVAHHGSADLGLDRLGRAVADEQVLLLSDVTDYRLVELVARDAQALRDDDPAEADDGDVGRAAPDVDDHAAGRLGDLHAGADRRRQRLLDEERLARADLPGGLQDGPAFHLGHAGRHADHHLRLEQPARSGEDLADERLQHLLREVVIGDDAVSHGTDGDYVARGAPEHAVRLLADGLDFTGVAHHGDHRGFAQQDPLALDVDQHGGRTEVDPDLLP